MAKKIELASGHGEYLGYCLIEHDRHTIGFVGSIHVHDEKGRPIAALVFGERDVNLLIEGEDPWKARSITYGGQIPILIDKGHNLEVMARGLSEIIIEHHHAGDLRTRRKPHDLFAECFRRGNANQQVTNAISPIAYKRKKDGGGQNKERG